MSPGGWMDGYRDVDKEEDNVMGDTPPSLMINDFHGYTRQ